MHRSRMFWCFWGLRVGDCVGHIGARHAISAPQYPPQRLPAISNVDLRSLVRTRGMSTRLYLLLSSGRRRTVPYFDHDFVDTVLHLQITTPRTLQPCTRVGEIQHQIMSRYPPLAKLNSSLDLPAEPPSTLIVKVSFPSYPCQAYSAGINSERSNHR